MKDNSWANLVFKPTPPKEISALPCGVRTTAWPNGLIHQHIVNVSQSTLEQAQICVAEWNRINKN